MSYTPYDKINQIYTDGIVWFCSKTLKKDRFGTPLNGQYDTKVERKEWFRYLGVTSQDILDARSLDTDVHLKIAVRGHLTIDTQWLVKFGQKTYEIYRCYYAYKRDEMEISLVEVQ